MKILLVTDQLLKIDNGQILGPPNFTNFLKRLTSLGELHLCLLECKPNDSRIQVYNDVINDYVKIDNISFIHKSFIWPSGNTLKVMKKAIDKVDLVIGYVPSLNAEVAQQLAHKAGKKYMAFMVACPWDGLWNQDWKRKIAAPYRYLMNRKVLRNSDYSLYVTGKFLQHRYPSNCLSAGISDVVLEKVSTEILNKRLDKISAMDNQKHINLATTAMLNVKYKGQRFVIEALKKLKELGYSDYRYYLIGGGSDRVLRSIAEKNGVADQVIFVGKVTHHEVFSILDSTDIYVHPSLQEGLPRSVVEAMSRALPCIGARTAAIPELLDNDYIVERESVTEIVDRLLKLRDKKLLAAQAERNFMEAAKYECSSLDARREEFFTAIRNDFNNNRASL